MKMKIKYILILLLYVVIIMPANSKDKKFEGLFWKVQSKTATVYLLGSIHVGNEGLYPLNPKIEGAYDESKYLVVETDVNKVDPYELMAKGLYQDTNTLENNVKPETYKIFKDEFDKYNIPDTYYNKFKPWLAVLTVMALEMQSDGYKKELGIDQSFLQKADSTKELLELESISEQMSLFDTFEDNQDAFIQFSLEDLNQTNDEIDEMVKFWKAGDADGLEKATLKPFKDNPELMPIYQKLIIDRNVKMTDKINNYLKTNDKYFVVVGAGHLIGKQGIISLLKKNKYTVKKY